MFTIIRAAQLAPTVWNRAQGAFSPKRSAERCIMAMSGPVSCGSEGRARGTTGPTFSRSQNESPRRVEVGKGDAEGANHRPTDMPVESGKSQSHVGPETARSCQCPLPVNVPLKLAIKERERVLRAAHCTRHGAPQDLCSRVVQRLHARFGSPGRTATVSRAQSRPVPRNRKKKQLRVTGYVGDFACQTPPAEASAKKKKRAD